jgi:hypothetical protein
MRFLFFISLFLFLEVSCESEDQVYQNNPEETIRGFFQALKDEEFKKASLYTTAETQESLRDFVANLNMISAEEKTILLSPFKMEVSKTNCSENQGVTICSLCCSPDGEIIVNMVQQDNKWFIEMEFGF